MKPRQFHRRDEIVGLAGTAGACSMVSPRQPKVRVFLVEKDAAVAAAIRAACPGFGAELCGHAARGDDAAAELPRLRPQAVLIGLHLGGNLGGVETARRLRTRWPGAIVLLGENAAAEPPTAAMDALAAEYLAPPFDARVLNATIQAARHRSELEQMRRARGSTAATRGILRARERETILASINSNLVGACVYRMLHHPDGQLDCMYISPAIEAMTGLTPAQVHADARIVLETAHPDDLPLLVTRLDEVRRTGDTLDLTIRTKPGCRVRWAHIRSHLTERRPDGVQVRDGVIVDVTATKEAETELAATRDRLELALRASRTCTWENDVAANQLTLDAAWAIMLGRPPRETVTDARQLIALAHPEDRARIVAVARRSIYGTADHYSVEHRVLTADGTWLWIQSRGRVTARDAHGRASRIIGTNTDISARRAAEDQVRDLNRNLAQLVSARTAALSESETRFRTLFAHSPVATSLATFPEGRIVELNAAVERVVGYTPAEVIGRTAAELGLWDDPADRARFIAELRTKGYVAGFETVFRRRGREPFPVIFTATAVEISGQPHVLVSIQDITIRRRAERRVAGLARLSRTLAEAVTVRAAACAILDTANELLGWDAAWFQLWNESTEAFEAAVLFDVIDGRRCEVAANPTALRDFSPIVRRTMEEGPQLDLRESEADDDGSHTFGSPRRSLSRLYAPFRREQQLLGMLSIQSYLPRAYDRDGLELLTAIADQAAGTLARLQAHAAFAASEERFRVLFQRNPVMLMLLTLPESRIVELNDAAVDAFGYTRAEAVGHTSLELNLWVDPQDRERILAELEVKGHVADVEVRLRRKNGIVFTALFRTSRIEIAGKSHSLNSLQDISAQRDTELRYQTLVESSGDGIFVMDCHDRIRSANATAARMHGYTVTELIGRPISELDDPADTEFARLAPALRQRLLGGEKASFELMHRRKDGSVFPIEVIAAPIQLGGETCILAAERDITERRRAQLALRESEARFRAVFDASPTPVLLSSAPDGRILEVNAVALATFGYTRDEVVGRTTAELGLWAQAERRNEFFQHIASGRGIQGLEAVMRTKDGTERTMLCTGSPVRIGQQSCVIAAALDITALRKAEADHAQVQARAFHAQKFEALGTLAGGVAHDFNNILTGIINFAALAQEDCPPGHPQIAEYLREVLKCGNRAKELVRQILLFSRAETAERAPLLLQHIVGEALALLRPVISATVQIETNIDRQAPLMLGNATQLHQVIMNLAVNAVQAMAERGGRLVIQLHTVTVDAALARELVDLQPGLHLCLEVTDNGHGMEPGLAARIFEPFFTTKKAGEGTGLGLAVVHSVVHDHEGAIRVRSERGVGSTFELLFPVHEAPADPGPAGAGELPRGSGQRILVVDDERAIAESLQLTLQRLGYQVVSFDQPEKALAHFWVQPESIDALFTDYQMPGMDGITLAQQVLSHGRNLPVIVASGFADDIAVEKMRDARISAFLQKPIEIADLAQALASALRQPGGDSRSGEV